VAAPPAAGPAPAPPAALVVEAAHDRDRTVITLRNPGSSPVDWTASTPADWLRLSRGSGTLAPGAAETVTVTVDSAAAPQGSWSADVRIQPGSSQVTIEGTTSGGSASPTEPEPTPSATAPAESASPAAAKP
ncbi:BACON domain-containing protein, partial [Yinghuangia soli]|nr:hypothetical protein [Yinghuangia soli]